uniref:Pol polyprotein n=1 Tax=Schistosoma japonicum TaxID=6182 RepID=C7C1Z4_SCHJA|nr:pol polyprotein [Schistosoma japonicum]
MPGSFKGRGRMLAGTVSKVDNNHVDVNSCIGMINKTDADMSHSSVDDREILPFKFPKFSPRVFDGNPVDYLGFVKELDVILSDSRISEEMKLMFLTGQCTGAAASAIKCCLLLPSGGYEEARRILKQRFGRPSVIASKAFDGVRGNGRQLKDSPQEIASFLDNLLVYKNVMVSLGKAHELDLITVIEMIVERLPTRLQEKWVDLSAFMEEKEIEPKFSDVLRLVESSVSQSMSRFGRLLKPISESGTSVFNCRSLVTNSDMVKEDKCILCLEGHNLDECSQFVSLRIPQRIGLAKRLGLCFKCLGAGHTNRYCRSGPSKDPYCSNYHSLLKEQPSNIRNKDCTDDGSCNERPYEDASSVSRRICATIRSSQNIDALNEVNLNSDLNSHSLCDSETMAVSVLEKTRELGAFPQVEVFESELVPITKCGFRTGYVNESAVTSLKANATLRSCRNRSLKNTLSGAVQMRLILEIKTLNLPIELLTPRFYTDLSLPMLSTIGYSNPVRKYNCTNRISEHNSFAYDADSTSIAWQTRDNGVTLRANVFPDIPFVIASSNHPGLNAASEHVQLKSADSISVCSIGIQARTSLAMKLMNCHNNVSPLKLVDNGCPKSSQCMYSVDHDIMKLIKGDVDYSCLKQCHRGVLNRILKNMTRSLCLVLLRYGSSTLTSQHINKPVVFAPKCSLDLVIRECLEPCLSNRRDNFGTIECNLVITVHKPSVYLIIIVVVTDLHFVTCHIYGCLEIVKWFSSFMLVHFILITWKLRLMTGGFCRRFDVQRHDKRIDDFPT